MIIVVFGLPGSGKSYFAQRPAAMLKAGYINSDQLRNKMFATRTYSTKEKLAVYDEILLQTRKALLQHANLVLDATFFTNNIRQKTLNEAKCCDRLIFIEVRASEALTKERLKRVRQDSEATIEVYEKIKSQWEPLEEDHLILQSSDENISDMIKKAMAYLQTVK